VARSTPDEIDGFGERSTVVAKGEHVFDDWDRPRVGIAGIDTDSGYSVGRQAGNGSDSGGPW
jgi:hypothetical protein